MESGIFHEDLALETVREEMDKFVTALKANESMNKEAIKALDTDFLLILRQTKLDGGKFVTKYQQVNTLTGPKDAVVAVHASLCSFNEAFKGSFTTQWALSVLE